MSEYADDAASRTMLFLGSLGDDAEGIAARLSRQSVVLRLGEPTAAGEIALAMAATLLLRMDRAAPAITVLAPSSRVRTLPGLSDAPLATALGDRHDGMASMSRFSTSLPRGAAVEFAFGESAAGIPVGSDGWIASLGSEGPASGNPIAAAMAGVLAANEALKRLILECGIPLQRVPRPWSGSVSLWDYTVDAVGLGRAAPASVDLGHVGFVGCGGVSAATFWTLALFGLTGAPSLIDDDVVDVTNLNRLLFASHQDIGQLKVELVKELLDLSGTTAVAQARRWEQLDNHDQREPDTVVVSVDRDPVRRRIQESLPAVILNGGTGDNGEYQVSRHDFVNAACLSCISHGDDVVESLEQRTARLLGIDPIAFLAHAASSDPLPDDLIERSSVDPDIQAELRRLPAKRLTQRFCDQLGSEPGKAVSAPTLSAMPGLLLAAEIVKRGLDAPELDHHNVVRGSVLRGPHKNWTMRIGKRPGCICTDETYRDHYLEQRQSRQSP